MAIATRTEVPSLASSEVAESVTAIGSIGPAAYLERGLRPAAAFSSAATRTHVDRPMPAASAALSSSSCSVLVVSTLMSVARRASSETGGRPIRGSSLVFLDLGTD